MSDTCSKHPTSIPGWDGTLKELSIAVENMRYDKTAEFLDYLSKAFASRGVKDKETGKTKLAELLWRVADDIFIASFNTEDAWKICKPHMLGVEED